MVHAAWVAATLVASCAEPGAATNDDDHPPARARDRKKVLPWQRLAHEATVSSARGESSLFRMPVPRTLEKVRSCLGTLLPVHMSSLLVSARGHRLRPLAPRACLRH